MAPVPVGSRLRAHLTLQDCKPLDAGTIQMRWRVTIERDGAAKPVCVAEPLMRHYP